MFKVTIKTPEQGQWRRFVTFEQVSYSTLVFSFLTLSR